MSDLSMYELGDIIWDDFDRGDDHIVPHPTNSLTSKKLRRETTPVLSNTGDSHTICQEKAEKDSTPLDKRKEMMEKESPSHAPHGVFNGSCDGEIVKDMPNLASDDVRMPDDCFKSSYATSATGDNNSYSFVDSNCEDKESGDLLYYGWPDIGNFEDVDKMLRSCDSSFGLSVTDNDGWFTSDRIEGTEEALKMDFKFPCPEPGGLKDTLQPPESNSHRSSCITESRGQGVGNDDASFYQISDSRLSSNNKSDQEYRNLEVNYFGHMQGNSCYLPPNYAHQNTTVPMPSVIKSEHKGPSAMGSSNASNQMGMMFQSSKGVLVSDEKLSVKEHVSQRDIEGVKIGVSNVQESSSVSSELDEISLEATSFRQLRQVMEQLDLRTKLCIRDSLYRLARSAEQRHINPSLSSGATDVHDLAGPLMSERTNNGFMDMETDTNPIDRSIAHLLFHRPSESLKLPTPFPPKTNLNHGSIPGRSVLAEKRVCEEEAAGESNEMMGGN